MLMLNINKFLSGHLYLELIQGFPEGEGGSQPQGWGRQPTIRSISSHKHEN